jgi:hypothetical protein
MLGRGHVSRLAAAAVARDEFAWTIWDTSPGLRYPDAIALAPCVDGVLSSPSRTRLASTTWSSSGTVRRADALLGIVMNRSGALWRRAVAWA